MGGQEVGAGHGVHILPNSHTAMFVVSMISASDVALNDDLMSLDEDEVHSRTELDSHANMVVVGRNCYVIQDTERKADVSAFSPDYEPLELPIVDAALAYYSPYDGKDYILVVRNALYVPSLEHNLIPPFILREAGLDVRDIPKIHVSDPTEEDHSIGFPGHDFRIPLSLWGVFSYFPTTAPTLQQIEECDDVYLLTPNGKWDPNSDVYAENESNMLDWEGNIIDKKDRVQILLDEVHEDKAMAITASISKVEATAIDNNLEGVDPIFAPNDGRTLNGNESPTYDAEFLSHALEEKAVESHFKASIGATVAQNGSYIFEGVPDLMAREDDSSISDSEDGDDLEDDSSSSGHDDDRVLIGEIDLDDIMASAAHARPRRTVDAEHLSKIWKIDLETAKRTLNVTSQNATRTPDASLSRNYATNDKMLRYTRIKEYFFMDTFFATKKAGKSSRGNSCCQLFVTDKGFVYVVPMKSKSEVLQAVKQFAKEIGAPEALICDAAREQKSEEVKKFCHEIGTTLRVLEEGTPWANKAELYIGLIKAAVSKDMKESNCPLAFWDYCIERRARINNLTARNLFQLHGTNPHTALTGSEGDISSLTQFRWYDFCYYRENREKFPFNKEVLGRVLGPARGEGNEMAQWILKANGNVVPRRSPRPLTVAELNSETEQKKRSIFDTLIEKRWGTAISPPQQSKHDDDEDREFEEYADEDESARVIPETEDSVDSRGRLIDQQPAYDQLINAEVQLQHEEEMVLGKVKQRALGPDGTTVGTYDENPYLNSIVYEVEFPDGQVKEYAANLIAENMLSQVDHEGYSTTLMAGIVDYQKDEATAVPKSEKWVVTKRGNRRLRRSTAGWKLLVQWKDGSETWVPLKDMKESHPVETAEFAKARGIDDEVAFAYWVPYTLRKRDVIIAAVKARARKVSHKYGIELPTSVEHAYELDKKNGNTFWRDAIKKEMHNVGIAFEILEDGENIPVGWKKASGHLVFDIKMTFERKARWVLDGHKTPSPTTSTYAGVVSRESVRIALTYAALNDLDVTAADIRNAYLQAPSSEKHYIICGPEFGLENVGKRALIRRALYGGKSAGRDFRNHLRACMRHLDFQSCPADPDVWMRPAKKSDGSEYYEYVLLYVDDVLVVSDRGEHLLRNGIGKYFELKEESIGPPELYLGGRLRKVVLENGVKTWAFSSSQYVQEAVKNVERYLEARDRKLPTKAETPIRTAYRPELDTTPVLDPAGAAYYQSLIGILRWIVELGRVDVCLEVSVMSSHVAMPREGQLLALFHIFSYLKKYHNTELVFDPSDPVIDESEFERKDWTSSEFGHIDGEEELPRNMPEPRGQGFKIRAKVDADHASDTVTRRSRTGFLVFLNCALIHWLSKKQSSVESSSFGSEFVAMKTLCEYLRGLRYKLRMMGIPVDGCCYIHADNKSVLANTTVPESTLKKKSQSIAYHYVREGVARDEWRTAYVNTHDNEADLLTKMLPAGEKRRGFVRNLLHHIFATSPG
jgi:hypothetical protein